MDISKRAREIQESPIRKLAAIATETKKRGTHIYHLNIGQPDIDTPPAFFEQITEKHSKVLAYGPSDGLEELKESMIDYFLRFQIKLEKHNICVTTAGSEAILFAFNAIADPGDEIVVPEPFYTNYNGFATLASLKLVPITTLAENGFHLPDMAEIEKRITPRTRALMICSPNNPTGTVFTQREIEQLGELAKKHDLFLIADEVYKEFTYDGSKHFSIMELPDMAERVIVADSVSKRYSACGARIGAVISRNGEIMKAILKFAQARLCPPTLEQLGAIGAYRLPADYFTDILLEYQKRRDILCDILTSHPGIVLQKPQGAFYIMAKLPINDSDDFARWMLESFQIDNETVMVAPGAGFYSTPGKGKDEIRIAYVLESEKLARAGKILLQAIDSYGR